MLIEMHSHTLEHSSCSRVSALDLVRRIHDKGLQGVILTDHHYLWSSEEMKKLRREAGVPGHFLILPAQEVNTPEFGDVLVYGATESLGRKTPVAEIRRRFPEAALVWAHPYRNGRIPSPEALSDPRLDGVEIFNSNQTVRENSRGLQDWHRERFTAIAGTDTHGGSYAGLYPTLFDHPLKTILDLAEEIRRGRCRPLLKEIPRSGAKSLVTEVTIGVKGRDEKRERIVIRSLDTRFKWQSAERAHRIMEEIARRGFDEGPFRVPLPIDEDPGTRTLLQRGLRGKTLFDKLLAAPAEDRGRYVQMAARWLARLHNCRLRLTDPEEFGAREAVRLGRYVERFSSAGHPHTRRAREVMEVILNRERHLLGTRTAPLVQGHGDYHPKNVIVGRDRMEDRRTLFVAAVDFESSLLLPPAFDVGCFLAQFRNQFFGHSEVLQSCPEELFLNAYLKASEIFEEDFPLQVELFRARTNLSIAAYLIKVGKGNSEDLWRVLLEAEQALATTAARQEERVP